MKPVEFSVNNESCIHCGQCARDCLFSLIEMGDFPAIPQDKAAKCIRCGHCQAICPTGSITLDGHASSTLEAVMPPPDETDLRNLIHRRRSIRHFSFEKVDTQLLERIIRLISWSPTGSNNRGVSYLVFNGRRQVERLLEATLSIMKKHDLYLPVVNAVECGQDQIFRGAPCLLLTHAPVQLLASVDCATALATLELALPTFGLASCWAGIFTRVCEHELPVGLEIPQGHKLYGGVMIGKPTIHYKRVPFRSLPEIVFIEDDLSSS